MNVKSPTGTLAQSSWRGHVRGFCTTDEQKDDLLCAGLTDYQIHMTGKAESLETALATFRARPGTLVIAGDMRVFGLTRRDLFATLRRLGQMKIEVACPSGESYASMLERAIRAIAKARFTGDRRKARRCGSRGGRARGISEWNKRDEIAPRWLLCNMVAALGAKKTAELVENKISESSFRRNYKLI